MVAPLSLPSTPAGWSDLRTAYVARAAYNGWPEAYAYARHANTMIAAIDAGTYPTGVPIPLQVWKLTGSPTLRIVFNGGEAISGAGVYYRGLYGGSNGIIFGSCANEVCCYVTGDGFWPPYAPSGSYEGGWDTDFPAAAGGSMLYYGYPGHMKFAEPQSIESVWAAALGPMLAGG
jgi:hypothetical protein